ncbi:MAG TPA: hydrolase Nlp/P60, partial [Pseudomonas sp.]|nr:hydrolase Nlp/P60 [Pseudomonas sp.]
MPLPARLTIILLAALLTACAGRSPVLEPSGVPPEPVSATAANDVLFRALGLVGTPYRYGGNTPDSGFDCSGLIGYVYRDAAGLALPRTTQQMSQAQGANVGREALQAGDLVFFATSGGRRVSHAGIYVGEGR